MDNIKIIKGYRKNWWCGCKIEGEPPYPWKQLEGHCEENISSFNGYIKRFICNKNEIINDIKYTKYNPYAGF